MATIDFNKLHHSYDLHASDFGLSGSKNLDRLVRLSAAIELHLVDPKTTLVYGHYRGAPARLHYNSFTKIVVVTNEGDQVVAGFKPSSAQGGYVVAKGRLS